MEVLLALGLLLGAFLLGSANSDARPDSTEPPPAVEANETRPELPGNEVQRPRCRYAEGPLPRRDLSLKGEPVHPARAHETDHHDPGHPDE